MPSDNTNSSEFTLQPDGSYGYHQLQPDGTYIYYQQLPDGAYGYYKPEADGTQSYFRQQADGSFVQWTRNADGTYAPPADAEAAPSAPVVEAQPTADTPVVEEVVVDAEIVDEAAESPVIPPAPSATPAQAAPGVPSVSPAPPTAPPTPVAVVPFTAPEGATPPPAKKGSKKGLLIGGIAAGAVVVLGAGAFGAVTFLIRGGDSGGTFVTDFAKEPTEAWSYDYSLGADTEYLWYTNLTAVGDTYLMIVPEFDYDAFYADQDSGSSWGDWTVWTPDYDAQYDEGWDAGQAYNEAYEAYLDDWDWDTDYPDVEDYWPGSSDLYDVDEATEGGLQDGFLDALSKNGYGSHKLLKPVEPDFEPSVAVINLDTGAEVWVKTTEELLGADVTVESVWGYDGTDYAVLETVNDEEYEVVVVNAATGETVATIAVDGWLYSVSSNDGWLYLAVVEDEGESTLVTAYTSSTLTADPQWEYEADGYASAYVRDTFLSVSGDDNEALELTTGEPTAFSRALDEDTWVTSVAGTLLRIEYDSDDSSYEISAIDKDGKDSWPKPVTTDVYQVVGDILIIGDDTDGYGISNIMRINPKDGSEMWKSELKDDYTGISGQQGDVFYLFDNKRVYQVNAKSGEVVQDTKIDNSSSYVAASALYVVDDDELVALNKKDLGERWSFDLDDNQWPVVMGSRLLIQDDAEFEIIGLQ